MSEYTEYVKQLECPELDPVKAVQQLLLEQLGWTLPAQPPPKITAKRDVEV